MQVLSASSSFDQLDLSIRSDAVDWLYQAILGLFGNAIRGQVNDGIAKVSSAYGQAGQVMQTMDLGVGSGVE